MTDAFLRFDLKSWFPRRQTLLTLAFVSVVGVLLPIPGMAILAAALITSLMVSTPFLADERGHLDVLYAILPISRTSVTAGRALSLVAYYVAASGLATAVTLVMLAVRGGAVAVELLLIAHAAAAAIVGIALAVQMPVFFRIGYSRGRLMAYAPTLVIAGAAWLLQATGLHTPLLEMLSEVPIGVVVAAGGSIGAIGALISVLASARLYRTREL